MIKTLATFAAVVVCAACSSNPTVTPTEKTPTPAAPTAPERVAGQQFAVFFGSGQSAITEQADETLREVATLIREFAPTRVEMVGHADTAEPDPDGVSKARADLVAQRLRALGVTAEFQARSAGAKELLIQTPAGTKEAQNRRVTIDY